jgi:hypothetical protein
MGALGMIVSFYENNVVNVTVLLQRVKKFFTPAHAGRALILRSLLQGG